MLDMAFRQSAGPPASHRQLEQLLGLLHGAGHTDFRDARGPMGFTQRQAGGKFTSEEADEFINQLEQVQFEGPPSSSDGAAPVAPTARPLKRTATVRALEKFSDQDLAAELQRRGWVVMEP